jgi:putative SOS response-associated peptidase YedK
MAGLWETWKPKEGDPVDTCTIITTTPNPMMAQLHNRMPVIIGDNDISAWLGEEPVEDAKVLLKPFDESRMTSWPVSKAIGAVKNQGRELAEPVTL